MEQGMRDGREIAPTLTEEETALLQSRLWALMARQTARYTAFDSSSVAIETARELFASVCFTLEAYLADKGLPRRALLSGDMEEMLRGGREALERESALGRTLWLDACNTAPAIQSGSYRDTLKSLGSFFGRYDLWYFAHQRPVDVDYQLCVPVSEDLAGINYVNQYLRELTAENKVLGAFQEGRVERLLKKVYGDVGGTVLNLCEPVIVNALGLSLCEREVKILGVTAAEKALIIDIFEPLPEDMGRARLREAAEGLCKKLCLSGDERELVLSVCQALYPRLHEAIDGGSLDVVFVEI